MDYKFKNKEMEELGIAGIFLFGSRAQKMHNPLSDFDFAILVKEKKILHDYIKRAKLYEKLYDIFSAQIKKICNIDIVFAQAVDLQLKYHIVKDGKLLYVGNQKIVSDFLENSMESYADFAPIRREFHKAIMERI